MVWIESTTLCSSSVRDHRTPDQRLPGSSPRNPDCGLPRRWRTGRSLSLSPIEKLSKDERELLSRILIRHFVGREVTYDLSGALTPGRGCSNGPGCSPQRI